MEPINAFAKVVKIKKNFLFANKLDDSHFTINAIDSASIVCSRESICFFGDTFVYVFMF